MVLSILDSPPLMCPPHRQPALPPDLRNRGDHLPNAFDGRNHFGVSRILLEWLSGTGRAPSPTAPPPGKATNYSLPVTAAPSLWRGPGGSAGCPDSPPITQFGFDSRRKSSLKTKSPPAKALPHMQPRKTTSVSFFKNHGSLLYHSSAVRLTRSEKFSREISRTKLSLAYLRYFNRLATAYQVFF